MLIPRENPLPALLSFTASWVPDLSPTHRVPARLIPSFVPAPLKAIYAFAGNYPVSYTEQWRTPNWIAGLFGKQDQLLPLDQLVVKRDRFAFIHENQGVWACETVIDQDDPPVFCDYGFYDNESANGAYEVCPSLSLFLTTFCLRELVFGSQNLFCVESEPKSPSELVANDVAPLWIAGKYVYDDEEALYSFYLCGRDLLIMCSQAPCDYWLAYNSEGASKLIDTKHEIRRIN